MRYVNARRGYATVLVMLLLVVGLVLSAWLFTAISNGTAIARNEQMAARALVSAESGLTFAMYQLRQVASTGGFRQTDTLQVIIQKIGTGLQGRAANGFMPGTTSVATGSASVSNVSYGTQGDTFGFQVTPSQIGRPGITVLATGTAGGASVERTICMEVTPKVLFGSSSMDYSIASKGEIDLPTGANAGIYRWNPETNLPDPEDEGQAYIGPPSFLIFQDSPDPVDNMAFPDKYLRNEVHQVLGEMASTGALTPYSATATSQSDVYITNSSKVVEIRGGTEAAPRVLNGIIYVEWPASIRLSGWIQLNGVIVYERPEILPADNKRPRIIMDKDVTILNDVNAAHALIEEKFESLYGSVSADSLVGMLENWAIHAPDTDLFLENGDQLGFRELWGNLHVAGLDGAGGGTADLSEMGKLIIHGQILCENDVDLSGNRVFCIEPPTAGDNLDYDRRLTLSVGNDAYWEKY